MTLALCQRRQIVKRFMAGESIARIEIDMVMTQDISSKEMVCGIVESVLRSYLNGEFKLAKRRRK